MTTPIFKNNHDRRCWEESTQDPIFLLQSRRLILIGLPFDENEEHFDTIDCELVRIKDKDGNKLDEPEYIDLSEWTKSSRIPDDFGIDKSIIEEWITESVWLDRKEAENWGKSHEYRFTYGWRVYSVPAKGNLSQHLRKI